MQRQTYAISGSKEKPVVFEISRTGVLCVLLMYRIHGRVKKKFHK
jgi:hypothetical protein